MRTPLRRSIAQVLKNRPRASPIQGAHNHPQLPPPAPATHTGARTAAAKVPLHEVFIGGVRPAACRRASLHHRFWRQSHRCLTGQNDSSAWPP